MAKRGRKPGIGRNFPKGAGRAGAAAVAPVSAICRLSSTIERT
ncbi:MAG TPA: hypothetical protein VKV32_05380 [Stellaceae bacterium]|nr:hypothetical protein [Stellaceae bacterium]